MTDEVDMIKHLLDIESESSEMLLEAQKEADSRTAQARAKAETQFKSEYTKKAEQIDSFEKSEKSKIEDDYQKNLSEYKENLVKLPKDKEAFTQTFESLLFA